MQKVPSCRSGLPADRAWEAVRQRHSGGVEPTPLSERALIRSQVHDLARCGLAVFVLGIVALVW